MIKEGVFLKKVNGYERYFIRVRVNGKLKLEGNFLTREYAEKVLKKRKEV